MNACLSQGRMPELWKAGEIVALYKKNNPRKLENYRPITLWDTIYKIFTRLIANRLSTYVEPYLRSTQYGFRKRRSTTHAIHVVRRTIEAFFHKSAPEHDLNVLMLDWSKAFDRVDSDTLSDALTAFGIGGTFLKAIESIFSNSFFKNGVEAPLLGIITFFPTALTFDKTSPTPTDEYLSGM